MRGCGVALAEGAGYDQRAISFTSEILLLLFVVDRVHCCWIYCTCKYLDMNKMR